MDFLRLISEDLQTLKSECKKKYPVIKEAAEKALESIVALQKQYASLLRVESAPGPGHPLFKCEALLRPFLLACNHATAPPKLIILSLVSMQRLVSWDAIHQSNVGSIVRVLQLQAEKNNSVEVQVKLLQTLLQLCTLGYEDTVNSTAASSANASANSGNGSPQSMAGATTSTASATSPSISDTGSDKSFKGEEEQQPPKASEESSALVKSEDLVMQAIWICVHLHGGSSGASSVVGNTAAMTIRQVVSLAFGKVYKSQEAKRAGVLVFQELCFMCREENGVWLKRTTTSPMSIALGVELLEAILASHSSLFRQDPEFTAILKQHFCSLVQSALETGCSEKAANAASAGSSGTSGGSLGGSNAVGGSASAPSGTFGTFFPVLVRVMRLASVVLSNFSDLLTKECAVIIQNLLGIISTGSFSQNPSSGSQNSSRTSSINGKVASVQESRFLSHQSTSSSSGPFGSGSSPAGTVNYVTWPVLLSLEVLNRLFAESSMIAAIAEYPDGVLTLMCRTISSVVTTSPPCDFKALSPGENVVLTRSGMEFLNEFEAPALQPFFSALRVAVSSQSNLLTSIFDLFQLSSAQESRSFDIVSQCVSGIAPFVLFAMNATMRHCRELELVTTCLKAYHLLATIASRVRTTHASVSEATTKRMEEIELACLRSLCAFSFILPDPLKMSSFAGKAAGSTPAGTSGGAVVSTANFNDLFLGEDDLGEEGDSYTVVLSWREVHAMKALFAAAQVMEEELTEVEWSLLLESFEVIAGLNDPRLKNGQSKLPSKCYRLSAFRVEDEDVDQQLAMLGNSIIEFFLNAPKLSDQAVSRLVTALRRVVWNQYGFPRANSPHSKSNSSPSAASSLDPGQELPILPHAQNVRVYQNFLGIGLTGSSTFVPCFSLRMLIQSATINKQCFVEVVNELVKLSVLTFPPGSNPLQLGPFQTYSTESLLQLVRNALLVGIESSPRAKDASTNNKSLLALAVQSFDQAELLSSVVKLMHADVKDKALGGLLELLNACGPVINLGWPTLLNCIQIAAESGDAKSQVLAFKCLRLVVDDLLVSIPKDFLENCVQCIGRFASVAKDVNISLTAINELWSVADIIGRQSKSLVSSTCSTPTNSAGGASESLTSAEVESSAKEIALWGCAFGELSRIALDERTEVRNCAINTLFSTAVTYGIHFALKEWQVFLDQTVFPLASKLTAQGVVVDNMNSGPSNNGSNSKAALVMHHSRDSARKQWDESRVLLLTGISRVLQTNSHCLLHHTEWFTSVWRELLRLVSLNAESGMSKEVVLAAVSALQTLLQISSTCDLEQFTHSQPVRAGAGMRVVGGTLMASSLSPPSSPSHSRKNAGSICLPPPMLWKEAFELHLQLCNQRFRKAREEQVTKWNEEEEQEIASAVVAVLIVVYTQSKDHEFKESNNVLKFLDMLELLLMRHVLCNDLNTKNVTNITTNSLQSRVLNAFEECGSFASHPQVHTKMLDQLIKYVHISDSRELVFFTRHALMSLAKLFASVTNEARTERFHAVLECIEPYMNLSSVMLLPNDDSDGSSNVSAAEKAASQLWKHALRVLLVLISHGLCATKLQQQYWKPLLAQIDGFLKSSVQCNASSKFSEEEQVLVLSVLECLVDSVLSMVTRGEQSLLKRDQITHYEDFCQALMNLLQEGLRIECKDKMLLKCCVRQLAMLGMQQEEKVLCKLSRSTLVKGCNSWLLLFSKAEEQQDKTQSPQTTSAFRETRELLIVVLDTTAEIGLSARSVLEMFSGLCTCITSNDLEIRRLVQKLLVQAQVAECCLQALDEQEKMASLSLDASSTVPAPASTAATSVPLSSSLSLDTERNDPVPPVIMIPDPIAPRNTAPFPAEADASNVTASSSSLGSESNQSWPPASSFH